MKNSFAVLEVSEAVATVPATAAASDVQNSGLDTRCIASLRAASTSELHKCALVDTTVVCSDVQSDGRNSALQKGTNSLQHCAQEGCCVEAGHWTQVPSRKRKNRLCIPSRSPVDHSGAGALALLESEQGQLNNIQQDLPFEVVLDSGAADHVADNADAPGYEVVPSAGSKAGSAFIAANGAQIPNRGKMMLSLGTQG